MAINLLMSIGIVRRLDALGRVVIPAEIREMFRLREKDPVEIFVSVEDRMIVLRPYVPGCVFCGSLAQLKEFGGRKVCDVCLQEVGQKK